ncbi:hypothetical protein D9M68_661960 [compost metagenome]
MEINQPAPAVARVDAQRIRRAKARHAVHQRARADRHVFIERLVAGRAPGEKRCRGLAARASRVVVLDFMVVPGDQPGARGMHGLQQRVALVQRVAVAEVLQAGRGGQAVRARQLRARVGGHRGLVDVIAQEHHQIQVFLPHLPVRGVVALFPALAGGKGKAHAWGQRVGRRRGAGAGRGGGCVAVHEPVEVPAVRAQPVDFHMNRMAQFGQRLRLAAANDATERFILGNFPLDGQRTLQRRGALGIGLGRTRDGAVEQSRPQHESVRRGGAARHAQFEQVALAPRGGDGPAGQLGGEGGGCCQLQEGSLLHAGSGMSEVRVALSMCRTIAKQVYRSGIYKVVPGAPGRPRREMITVQRACFPLSVRIGPGA